MFTPTFLLSRPVLLCLGAWSHLGYINSEDVVSVSKLPDVTGVDDKEEGWDVIIID